MAVKSVLSIDIDDSSFKEYQDRFNKYQEAVKALPTAWKDVGSSTKNAGEAFADVASGIQAANANLADAGLLTKSIQTAASGVSGAFHAAAGHARSISLSIASATEKLLKWGGILGGLVGVGGLFGLDRLAATAGTGRRESMGLGVPYGTMRAFQTNLSRYIDPSAFLGGISTAATDPTSEQLRALMAAGMSPAALSTMDTGQAALAALPNIQRMLQSTPLSMLGPMMEATGLSSLLSLDQARTLRATPASELAQTIRTTRKDAAEMAIPPKVLADWSNLSVQLTRAGNIIQSALIEGLAPLTPQLTRLSDAFAKVVTQFLHSDTFKHWIDVATDALAHFGNYVGKPEFAKDVQSFITNVGNLAEATYHAVKTIVSWTNWLADKLPSGDTGAAAIGGGVLGGAVGWAFGGPLGSALGAYGGYKFGGWLGAAAGDWQSGARHVSIGDPLPTWEGFSNWWQGFAPTWLGGTEGPIPSDRAQKLINLTNDFMKLGWSKAQAEGIAANIWTESKGNPYIANASGHVGIGQWDAARQGNFAALYGHALAGSSLAEQEQFYDWELRHGYGGSLLSKTDDAAMAAAIVSRYMERPGDPGREMINRANLARQLDQSSRSSSKDKADQDRRLARDKRLRDQKQSLTIINQTGGSATIVGAGLGAAYG